MKSWPKVKLGQVIICSNLPLFGPKIPFLSIFILTYLYLPLFTYIWLNYPYLGIFAPNCPDFTICAIFTLYFVHALFYWDCTSVQNFRAIGPLFMEILHFKDLGDTSVISKCSLCVNLVIDNLFYVVSDTSPLYKIWKQSDHYLWRYCILKIWGIQVSLANAIWVLI